MKGVFTLASILALGLVAGQAGPASAQLYRWTNERGELHITEGLDSVPERFRAGAVTLGYPPARPSAAPSGAAGTPAAGATAETASDPRVLARIAYVPGVPILVTVRINGGRSVQLVLDTGADKTMISPQTLSALGVDMRPVRRGTIRGVTGTTDVESIVLESVEVGEAKAGPLEVVAFNPNLTRGEGLLGRDFLDRFNLNIDSRAREVVLGRR